MTHLTAGDLAGYLDRVLPPPERQRVESHLAECDECRAELVQVARVVRGRRQRRWMIALPAAAAAGVALLLLVRPVATPPGEPVTRGGGDEPGATVVAVAAPVEDAVVPRGGTTFVWRPLREEASYRVTVTDATGGVVWTGSTSDTALALPPTVSLAGGRSYFWYVDALLPDGRSATSGVRSFRTAP